MPSHKPTFRSLAFFLVASATLSVQSQTWNNSPTGTWSNPANWIGGVPQPGADLTFISTYNQFIAYNNIGNPLPLKSITLQVQNTPRDWWTSHAQVGTHTNNSIRFSGPNPFMKFEGTGTGNFFTFIQLDGPVQVINQSHGSLHLYPGLISNGSTNGQLVFDSQPASSRTGLTYLFHTTLGTPSFTGGVTLNKGNLVFIGPQSTTPSLYDPFGPGGLTANGGTIFTYDPIILNNAINIAGNVNFDMPNLGVSALTLNSTSQLSGTGSLNIRSNAGTMEVQTNSSFSGQVNMSLADHFFSRNNRPSLRLSGPNGSLSSVPNFNLSDGGQLFLDNRSNSGTNRLRISENANVVLRGGEVRIDGQSGTSGTAFTQTIGSLDVSSGGNLIHINVPANAPNVSLLANNSSRSNRSNLLILASNFGSSASTGVGRVQLPGFSNQLVGGGGADGSVSVSILPFAASVFSSGWTSSFVTLNNAGLVRPLTTAEQQLNSLTGSNSNVRITTSLTATGQTVNSLQVSGNLSGTINVASGAVMGSGSMSGNINFGNAEGIIYTPSWWTLSGQLSGSNGLTLASAGLNLRGNNTGLTGPLTLNAATINITNANQLPGTGPIEVWSPPPIPDGGYGIGNGIQYASTAPSLLQVSRSFRVNRGYLGLSNQSGAGVPGVMEVSGVISGPGGLAVFGTGTLRAIRVSGANSYAGSTLVSNALLEISSDASLGTGNFMELDASTLRLRGNWTTQKHINVRSDVSIDTNGFDANLGGILGRETRPGEPQSDSSRLFTKIGAGDLLITGLIRNPFNFSLQNGSGGTFTLASDLRTSTLRFDGTGAAAKFRGNGRLGFVTFASTSGTISPGVSGPGVIQLGQLSLGSVDNLTSPPRFEFDLGNPANSDRLIIDNNMTGSGATSVFTFSMRALPGIAAGNVYTLATFGSTTMSLANFASVWPGNPGYSGTFEWDNPASPKALRYRINPVPEPGTMIALGAGLAVLLRRRKAKKG